MFRSRIAKRCNHPLALCEIQLLNKSRTSRDRAFNTNNAPPATGRSLAVYHLIGPDIRSGPGHVHAAHDNRSLRALLIHEMMIPRPMKLPMTVIMLRV